MLVGGVNQVEKVRRDGQRELVICEFCAGKFLRRERGHQALQLLGRRDAMFELPTPVLPVGVRNVMPETAAGGAKFL